MKNENGMARTKNQQDRAVMMLMIESNSAPKVKIVSSGGETSFKTSSLPRQINVVTPHACQIPQSAAHPVAQTAQVQLETVAGEGFDEVASDVLDLVDLALEPAQVLARVQTR